ncbi:MAG: hypothetical protein GWP42_13690, partial [Verrucomicrobiales bacterium]|nr:hypothetical protein [Verrucomicrobiales bacterium]
MPYNVSRDGKQYGPYSLKELKAYLEAGNIFSNDLVYDGNNWITVAQFLGLTTSTPFEGTQDTTNSKLYIPPTQSSSIIIPANSTTTNNYSPYRKRQSFVPILWWTFANLFIFFVGRNIFGRDVILDMERGFAAQMYVMLQAVIFIGALGILWAWLKDLLFGVSASNVAGPG